MKQDPKPDLSKMSTVLALHAIVSLVKAIPCAFVVLVLTMPVLPKLSKSNLFWWVLLVFFWAIFHLPTFLKICGALRRHQSYPLSNRWLHFSELGITAWLWLIEITPREVSGYTDENMRGVRLMFESILALILIYHLLLCFVARTKISWVNILIWALSFSAIVHEFLRD